MTQTQAPAPAPPRRKAPFFVEFYRSAVGRKWAMAISGIMLLGFVLAHMLGNLHLYEEPNRINEYAEGLRTLGGSIFPREFLLWVLRVGLIAAFFIHIQAAYSLSWRNWRRRPVRYDAAREYVIANYASRTMAWTGTIVLLFLAWHLADLTFGWVNPDFVAGDVRNNLISSFERWPVALLYIVANLALGLHIYHGAWSMFQSLGANNPRFNQWRRYFATAFAAIIVIGNLSFPILVVTDLVN